LLVQLWAIGELLESSSLNPGKKKKTTKSLEVLTRRRVGDDKDEVKEVTI